MDRNRFNRDVHAHLTEIPIGVQGIAFDRQELDAWADEYKGAHGRPARQRAASTREATDRGSRSDFDELVDNIIGRRSKK